MSEFQRIICVLVAITFNLYLLIFILSATGHLNNTREDKSESAEESQDTVVAYVIIGLSLIGGI